MKVLIVGDGNHYFNQKLVAELRNHNSKLFLQFCSITGFTNPGYYDEEFDISVSKIPKIFNFKGIRSFYFAYHRRKKIKKVILNTDFEIIHFQGIYPWASHLIKNTISNSKKKIVTVWGSDFYRSRQRDSIRIKTIADNVDTLTFANNMTSKDFGKIYNSHKKHQIIRFGLSTLDKIKSLKATHTSSTDKLIVTIGYNRNKAHNHLLILDQIAKLPTNLKQGLKLLLPLTYGQIDKIYIQQIELKLKSLGVDFEILSNFQNENQMARHALNSNIMIQLQKTDSFSGTMQEYIYANNIVITGDWLPYEDLDNENIVIYKIKAIDELATELKYCIKNYHDLQEKVAKNSSGIYHLSSWQSNILLWNDLYMS